MRRKRIELEQNIIRAAREWCRTDDVTDEHLEADYNALVDAVEALDAYGASEIVASRGTVGHDHPDTAQDAASLAVIVQGHVRRLIVDDVAAAQATVQKGLTCQEAELRLRRPHTTVSSAVNWLMNAGWLEDSGLRRPTQAGRQAIVWQLTAAGLRQRRS